MSSWKFQWAQWVVVGLEMGQGLLTGIACPHPDLLCSWNLPSRNILKDKGVVGIVGLTECEVEEGKARCAGWWVAHLRAEPGRQQEAWGVSGLVEVRTWGCRGPLGPELR